MKYQIFIFQVEKERFYEFVGELTFDTKEKEERTQLEQIYLENRVATKIFEKVLNFEQKRKIV